MQMRSGENPQPKRDVDRRYGNEPAGGRDGLQQRRRKVMDQTFSSDAVIQERVSRSGRAPECNGRSAKDGGEDEGKGVPCPGMVCGWSALVKAQERPVQGWWQG